MFASCANSSDSDDENPSPSLPENVGENPIKETVKLIPENDSYHYLELKTDGTALQIYIDDHKNNAEETVIKYKYTYDADVKKIYMRVEKVAYDGEFYSEAEGKLLTYNEYLSKLDEDLTEKNMKQSIKEEYERNKDEDKFKENYPDCNSYEDYEKEILKGIKEAGFDSLDAYAKYMKPFYEYYCKATFGAQITYAYKTTDGKITLTEKFTGVKNLLNSRCKYDGYDANQNYTYARIDCTGSSIQSKENGVYYYYYDNATLDTDKRTIDFVKEKETRSDDGDYEYETLGNVSATYIEDIGKGRVTINCEGKDYVCEFEGEVYTQE